MINLKIVTPNGVYKETSTSILNIKTIDGERGLLTNHIPTVLMLEISKMSTIEDGERKEYAIGGGMLYFKDNLATLLVDSIESKDEIDVDRALKAQERAKGYLISKDPNIDLKRAQLALNRSLNRLKIVGRI